MSEVKCSTCLDFGNYAAESCYEDTYIYCDCVAGFRLRAKDARARLIRAGVHMPFRQEKEDAIKDAQEAADYNRCNYRVYWNHIINSWGSTRADDASIFNRDADEIVKPAQQHCGTS